MIKIHKFQAEEDEFHLVFDFELFNLKTFKDDQIFQSREAAAGYLLGSKVDVLKMNFEKFIFSSEATLDKSNELKLKALERCYAANTYFNKEGLSLRKICDMTIKMQGYLVKLLPETKNKDYEKQFSNLNNLIGFCKSEVKDQKDNCAVQQIG